jgi:hypothetical protein
MAAKFKKTFSAAKSCPKQAKAKIYLIFCPHIWKQRFVLEELCWHLYWWCPVNGWFHERFCLSHKKIKS